MMAASLSIVRPDPIDDPGLQAAGRRAPSGAPARESAPVGGREHLRRPDLIVVPGRRRVTRYVVSMTMVIAGAMGGVVFFNIKNAGRQIRIDRIESELATEQARFDELRSARANLRAPARLAELGTELGMVSGEEAKFSEIDPAAYARYLALNGELPESEDDSGFGDGIEEPMDQYRTVKEMMELEP